MSRLQRSRAPPRKRKTVVVEVEAESPRVSHKVAPFVSKLRTILATADESVARWSDDGASFYINEELAPETIISQHFAHSSWRSLLRQLSCYGFRKARRKKLGPSNTGWSEFAHDCFVRDHPELMAKIKRMDHLSATPGRSPTDGPPAVTDVKRSRTVSDDSDDDISTQQPKRLNVQSNLDGLAALGFAANQVLQPRDLSSLSPPSSPPKTDARDARNPVARLEPQVTRTVSSVLQPKFPTHDVTAMVAELTYLRLRCADLERIVDRLTGEGARLAKYTPTTAAV